MNDGNALQGGPLSTGSPALGQVMISPNGYYLQDLTPYQEYAYPPPYVYQSAPEAQPQVGAHHTAVIQYSPAAPPQPPQPRPLYDSPVMLPEVSAIIAVVVKLYLSIAYLNLLSIKSNLIIAAIFSPLPHYLRILIDCITIKLECFKLSLFL